jgi:hypothetical protein
MPCRTLLPLPNLMMWLLLLIFQLLQGARRRCSCAGPCICCVRRGPATAGAHGLHTVRTAQLGGHSMAQHGTAQHITAQHSTARWAQRSKLVLGYEPAAQPMDCAFQLPQRLVNRPLQQSMHLLHAHAFVTPSSYLPPVYLACRERLHHPLTGLLRPNSFQDLGEAQLSVYYCRTLSHSASTDADVLRCCYCCYCCCCCCLHTWRAGSGCMTR